MDAGDLALRFAQALAAGQNDQAHALLTPPLQDQVSAADLAEEYVSMSSYSPHPADTIELGEIQSGAGWPHALGWQWVSIRCQHALSDCWFEGVDLLIVEEGDRIAIGDIIWGRP